MSMTTITAKPDDSDRDRIAFSTGKKVYANLGIVGIAPNLDVSEGYDGSISGPDDGWECPERRLTPDEAVALGEMMIARWQAFVEKWK
jgi:hypothetical protein